jgi:hypothetical protein
MFPHQNTTSISLPTCFAHLTLLNSTTRIIFGELKIYGSAHFEVSYSIFLLPSYRFKHFPQNSALEDLGLCHSLKCHTGSVVTPKINKNMYDTSTFLVCVGFKRFKKKKKKKKKNTTLNFVYGTQFHYLEERITCYGWTPLTHQTAYWRTQLGVCLLDERNGLTAGLF